MDIESFYTVDAAEEGIMVPLVSPDGDKTEEWLKIRGVDSDIFGQAKIVSSRKAVEVSEIKNDEKRYQGMLDLKAELIGSLVIDWSFDSECTPDNIKKLLSKAPQIQDMIDKVAGDRKLFFSIKSNNSEFMSANKQSSTESLKDQTLQKEPV